LLARRTGLYQVERPEAQPGGAPCTRRSGSPRRNGGGIPIRRNGPTQRAIAVFDKPVGVDRTSTGRAGSGPPVDSTGVPARTARRRGARRFPGLRDSRWRPHYLMVWPSLALCVSHPLLSRCEFQHLSPGCAGMLMQATRRRGRQTCLSHRKSASVSSFSRTWRACMIAHPIFPAPRSSVACWSTRTERYVTV
jgi:hypothetical protein